MEQLRDRCCGIDVHQAELTAWVRLAEGKRLDEHVQNFGTTTPDLMALRDWLSAHRVTHVAMEATGVYWKCVYYALEDDVEVILVNAAHIKHVPGRKTDIIDAALDRRRVEVDMCLVFTFDPSGLAKEEVVYSDAATMFRQLGLTGE